MTTTHKRFCISGGPADGTRFDSYGTAVRTIHELKAGYITTEYVRVPLRHLASIARHNQQQHNGRERA